MTEAEWLVSDLPMSMLGHLRDVSERKLRLCMVAALRTAWNRSDFMDVVDTVERFADGRSSDSELDAARNRLEASGTSLAANCWVSFEALTWSSSDLLPIRNARGWRGLCRIARAGFVNSVRDIFGNPFRPVAFSPEWRTSTAVALAQQMYELRDFSPMPLLADALEDAGCDNADILDHCRDMKAMHVRGCWVVDQVLGKGWLARII